MIMTKRDENETGKVGLLNYIVLILVTVFLFQLQGVKDASADPFSRGNVNLSVTAGGAHAFGDDYLIIGLGAGYYLRDGLELGLDFDAWVGGELDIYSISPQVNYVFRNQTKIKPYGGAFYRHTFIDKLDDVDSLGLRGGINLMMGKNAYLGIGAVYENYLDCEKSVYRSCDDLYPEVVLSVSF
jgi:hypothetical protein